MSDLTNRATPPRSIFMALLLLVILSLFNCGLSLWTWKLASKTEENLMHVWNQTSQIQRGLLERFGVPPLQAGQTLEDYYQRHPEFRNRR